MVPSSIDVDAPPVNILLVDDRPENLLALKAILKPLKQNVVVANSGHEALRHILVQDFALILLDVQMPELDGFETAQFIKQRERSKHIPIIFLTAMNTEARYVFRGYEVGAVDYLFKPFDPDILRSKVAAFVELTQQGEKIAEQARDLERINRELHVSDELKTHFVAMASHELRTPVTSISGFSSTLIHRWDAISDEEKLHFVQIIDAESVRLSRLVNGLLALSHITSGAVKTQMTQVQLSPEIDSAILTLAGRVEVQVSCPSRLIAMADPSHLRQILINYLSNAEKYGAGPITVSVHERSDWVEIRVADSGTGVDPEFVPLLFQEFAQAVHTSQEDGVGLGLSIARGLAGAQGGEAFYEPNDPHGAIFGVRLPKAKSRRSMRERSNIASSPDHPVDLSPTT